MAINCRRVLANLIQKPTINKRIDDLDWCIHGKFQYRNFYGTSSEVNTNRKVFKNRKLLGYSIQEMYNVVSDVEKYETFLPFCRESRILSRNGNLVRARLDIGFPPITESYISNVTEEAPYRITVLCGKGRIFNRLETTWRFSPGLKSNERSCIVDFHLGFEYRSALYAQVANYFFMQLVDQVEKAFTNEARRRYGEATTKALRLTMVESND